MSTDDRESKPHRRVQTATERDLEGVRARHERDSAVPILTETSEEITGRYEGEDLEQMRARRPTPKRIKLLEVKHDDLGKRLGHVEVAVADLGGQMKILPELVSTMRNATEALQQRDHITFTSKVSVDTAERLKETEVDKAKELDAIDARKTTRKRITKIIGGVVTLLTSGAAIHWLMGKL